MKPPIITSALKQAVADYMTTTAFVETIKPDILTTRQQTLDAFPVRWDEERRERRFNAPATATITDPDLLYLGNEEDTARYYAEMDKAHARLGYTVPAGYCPLLMAEYERLKTMWAIVDEAEYFSTITREQATRNVKRFHEIVDTIVNLVFSLEGITQQ